MVGRVRGLESRAGYIGSCRAMRDAHGRVENTIRGRREGIVMNGQGRTAMGASDVVAVGLPVMGAVVSGLLVFLPEYSKSTFSLAEQLLLCGGTFVAIVTAEMLWVVRRTAELRRAEYETWTVRTEVDRLLRQVRDAFERVHANRYGDEDLFVTHFERKLTDIAESIGRAAENLELQVWNHHFESVKTVMNVFAGDEDPGYRCTWCIRTGDRLFGDSHWKSYFAQMCEMIGSGTLQEVKTLIVVDEWCRLDEARLDAVLSFYQTNERMECRLILGEEYSKFRRDAELPASDGDLVYSVRGCCFERRRKKKRPECFVSTRS